jgi:hypothetical protein
MVEVDKKIINMSKLFSLLFFNQSSQSILTFTANYVASKVGQVSFPFVIPADAVSDIYNVLLQRLVKASCVFFQSDEMSGIY